MASGSVGYYSTGLTESELVEGQARGAYDIFLRYSNYSGSVAWTKQFGTPYSDFAKALAVDSEGNLYLGGYTNGDFQNDATGYPSDQCFLVKLNSDGDVLWYTEFGSSNSEVSDQLYAVAPDPADGVFGVGQTRGDLFAVNQGYSDAIVVNYRWDEVVKDYVPNWQKQFGSFWEDALMAAIATEDGGLIAAGYSNGSLFHENAGMSDAIMVRYSSEGDQIWAKQFGGEGYDAAEALAPALDGGFYMAGLTQNELASGELQGYIDAFVARFDLDGNLLWIHQLGSGGEDKALALAPDGQGGVYLAGYTTGEMVDGQYGGQKDAFVAHYDASGNLLWLGQKGTPGDDIAWAVGADTATNTALVGGQAADALSADSTFAGFVDAFVARVGP